MTNPTTYPTMTTPLTTPTPKPKPSPLPPTLPHPFCPPTSPPPSLARLQHAWLVRNAPVLVQPSIDIVAGNTLLCVFYHFTVDMASCVLSLVYEGEASWDAGRPTVVNRFGSFCYRTHNVRLYGRTADIDHIAYHQCNVMPADEQNGVVSDAGRPDWQVLHTTDFSGLQSWSKGSKARFLHFYTFMHHYDLEMGREGWRQWHDQWTPQQQHDQLEQWRAIDLRHHTANTPLHDRLHHNHTTQPTQPIDAQPTPYYRPVVYLNTGNHTMSPFSTNPTTFSSTACTVHSSYPLYAGDRAVAECFGRLAVARKWTLFSCVPGWAGRAGGGGGGGGGGREWRRMHHSVLLEGAVEVERRARDEGVEDEERKEKMSVRDGNGHVLAVVESLDVGAGVELNADRS